nr:MFS transporter [Geminicoccus roseus]
MLLPALSTSIAQVGLPALARSFDASFQHVQWVVLAYLLAITTLIVGAGRLGDLAGRKRLLLAGILLFTIASAACGMAPTLGALIAARAMQGVGAAIMMALTMALAGGIVPKAQSGSAMGLLGAMSAVGTALGPSLGGFLIAGLGWRALFLVTVPLGILALGAAWLSLPDERPGRETARTGFDIAGTVLLGSALAAYALAMTIGRGQFGLPSLALLLGAALAGWLFVRAEGRTASPLIRLPMFRNPVLRAGLAMSALVATVMMTTLVVGPFHLVSGLELDAASAGLALTTGPLVAALVGIPAGRFVDRLGAPRMTVLGLAGMTAGCCALALLPADLGVAGYVLPVVVVTAGYALFQTANNTSVMAEAGLDQRGVVSALLNLSRNLGLITGASVMGAVFALASGATAITASQPASVAGGMRITFAVAALLVLVALVLALATARRTRGVQ